MDANWIIAIFVVVDDMLTTLGHASDVRAQVPDPEIILIALVAAKYLDC